MVSNLKAVEDGGGEIILGPEVLLPSPVVALTPRPGQRTRAKIFARASSPLRPPSLSLPSSSSLEREELLGHSPHDSFGQGFVYRNGSG